MVGGQRLRGAYEQYASFAKRRTPVRSLSIGSAPQDTRTMDHDATSELSSHKLQH